MTSRPSDTDREADRLQVRVLRAMPVWQRLAQVDALNTLADALALADLRRRHPQAGEAALREWLRDRRLLALGLPSMPPASVADPDRTP
jgi:hypothetical protein